MSLVLTDLQLRFCQEYAKSLNATQAYIRAGYQIKNDNSAAASASKLLRNPKIKAHLGEIINLSDVSVISEVVAIAFAKITDVASHDGISLTIKPTTQWSSRAKSSVKSITFTEVEMGMKTTRNTTITMHDKMSALEKLMKKLRLYPKELSTFQAVQYLLVQGLLTSEQARVILDGISGIEEELRSLVTEQTTNE